jgi:hypothetical protein
LILVTRLASTFVLRERQNADVVAGTHYLNQAFDFGMRFDAAYWHVCKHRLALTGQGGPLDLRAQQCRPLLACYLSREKHICWTSIRERWHLRDEPLGAEAIVGVSALLEQPSGYARAKGIKVCDRWLRQHGLPGTRKHKLRWPAIIPRHVFSSCLHDIRLCLLKTLVGKLDNKDSPKSKQLVPGVPTSQSFGNILLFAKVHCQLICLTNHLESWTLAAKTGYK